MFLWFGRHASLIEAPRDRLHILYKNLKPDRKIVIVVIIYKMLFQEEDREWRKTKAARGQAVDRVFEKEKIWEVVDDEFSFISVD